MKKYSALTSLLIEQVCKVHVNIIRKVKMFQYWYKILNSYENSIIKRMYIVLKSNANDNITYDSQN